MAVSPAVAPESYRLRPQKSWPSRIRGATLLGTLLGFKAEAPSPHDAGMSAVISETGDTNIMPSTEMRLKGAFLPELRRPGRIHSLRVGNETRRVYGAEAHAETTATGRKNYDVLLLHRVSRPRWQRRFLWRRASSSWRSNERTRHESRTGSRETTVHQTRGQIPDHRCTNVPVFVQKEFGFWRKGRDSNPRGAHHAYAISSRAHSAKLCDPSRRGGEGGIRTHGGY